MNMIVRPVKTELFKRLQHEPRRFIQCLYGPRQVGKTTLIFQLEAELSFPLIYASADAINDPEGAWIHAQWESARLRLAQESHEAVVLVIDEIQKIQQWSEYVKREWDQDTRTKTQVKVVVLGSSRLLLQQGLSESLAGRFETIYVPHWSYTEMKEAFDFRAEQFAFYGGYPGAAPLITDEGRWREYVINSLMETSVSKDILMLTRIDKPALLKRLFELGSTYSGKELSYTKMLGQLQDAGNTVTLSHYLNLLDQAGLLAGLEKHAGQKVRQRGSSPKFQAHNNALMTAYMPMSFEEWTRQPEAVGRVVESAVGAHLINASVAHSMKLGYWRDGLNEVDFVLEHKGKLIGIEVKSGARQKHSGLAKFAQAFQPHRTLVVGYSGIDWREFLQIPPVDLF